MKIADCIVNQTISIIRNEKNNIVEKGIDNHPIGYHVYQLDMSKLNLIIPLLELGAAVANSNTFDLNLLSDNDKQLIYHKMFEYKSKEVVLAEDIKDVQRMLEESLRRDLND